MLETERAGGHVSHGATRARSARALAPMSRADGDADSDTDYVALEAEPGPRGWSGVERSASDVTPALAPDWAGRNEVVRDLHRSLLPCHDERVIPSSKSMEGMRLSAAHRLHPDVGTASELAQPGGFRRAYLARVDEAALNAAGSSEVATRAEPSRRALLRRGTPLLVVLEREGFINAFVTSAVQRLEDGTEVRYESRPYRRGALPRIMRTATGEELEPTVRLRFIGFRGDSVPYWSSLSFFVGAALFTEGSFYWMAVGADAAPAWAVTYPFFIGGVCFLAGCYLAFVEVINANLSEALAAGSLRPVGAAHRSRLYWWRFQPKSLLWWGALVQLVGACCFQIGLSADLPCVGLAGYFDHVVWVYNTSVAGSACFVFASYVYLLEVAEDPANPWTPPKGLRERLGFGVAASNLAGSVLFLIGSLFYYARDWTFGIATDWGGAMYPWELFANVWGVRFVFGVGSVCFVVGSVCSFPELLSDA